MSTSLLSFPTYEEAEAAMISINNNSKLVEAGRPLVVGDAETRKVVEQITICHLGVNAQFLDGGQRASWARPRRARYDYDATDHDYYDDCPDTFDRDGWNAYCEGRD